MKNSRKSFLFLLSLGIFYFVFQVPAVAQIEENDHLRIHRVFIQKSTNKFENEAIEILNALKINTKIFSLQFQTKSGNASRYAIFLHGLQVHKGYLVVWKEKNDFSKILVPTFNFESAGQLAMPSLSETKKDFLYAFKDDQWIRLQAKVREQGNDIKNSWLDYYDENGEIQFSDDWLLKAGPDSLVKATVFRPDPVSKYQMTYGGQLRDKGDSTSSFLDAAMDTVSIKVKLENDTFSLQNQWFKLGDYALPNKPLAKKINPDFCFKRDNPFFEEVNVFYHLNLFRTFIDSLGFSQMANYQLRIDAHGMDGADQSAYSPVQDILAYGDGNVDDAEDAGVIVHEYCHALANSAIQFGNSGSERRALEEGFCDYLAGSYCKSISNWNWESLFKWDGHNEFWSGRNLLSPKVYPVDLSGQIHADGEIFSSALSHIELQIGRKKTHQLLLNSLPFFIPGMKMRQATLIMLQSDSTLFNGDDVAFMNTAFLNRGIHPSQIIVSGELEAKDVTAKNIRILQMQGKLTVKNIGKESGDVFILDQNGRVLRKISEFSPMQEISIPNKGMPNGLYIVRFIGAKSSDIQRFIKTSD
jgi:hypothetical protein